jgi:hypothetical protein
MADSGTFDVTPEQWIRVKSAVLAKTSIAITADSGYCVRIAIPSLVSAETVLSGLRPL